MDPFLDDLRGRYASEKKTILSLCERGESFSLADLAKELGDDMKFEDFQPVITEATGLLFEGDKDDPMKLKDEELATLKSAYGRHKGADMGALVSSVIEIFDGKAGLAWTSGSHTALPVKTSATGVGAELFHGHFDNTDVAKTLKLLVVD